MTEPRPTAGDDAVTDLQAAVSDLLRAERRLRGRARGDLTVNHVRALVHLVRSGVATPGEISRETGLNPASVTGMLDQLEAQGLVERERGTEDRRTVQVRLTDHGREVVAAKRRLWRHAGREALGDIQTEDLATATRVIARVTAFYDGLAR